MTPNQRRGLFRVYIAAWIGWLLFLLISMNQAGSPNEIAIETSPLNFFLLWLVPPLLLLLAIRWIYSAFNRGDGQPMPPGRDLAGRFVKRSD